MVGLYKATEKQLDLFPVSDAAIITSEIGKRETGSLLDDHLLHETLHIHSFYNNPVLIVRELGLMPGSSDTIPRKYIVLSKRYLNMRIGGTAFRPLSWQYVSFNSSTTNEKSTNSLIWRNILSFGTTWSSICIKGLSVKDYWFEIIRYTTWKYC